MVKLISKASFLCLSQDCFFFLCLSQYLVNKGITVSQISFFLMVKKISQILTEVPFGFFFERFNTKILFIISRLFKIISMLMLFAFTDTFNLIIASIIGGFAVSSLFSKIDVFIYNSLEERGKVNLFPKAIAGYYFMTDFLIVWMYFISGFLIENFSYATILKISIIFVASSFPVILTINDKKLKRINLENKDSKKNFDYLKSKIQSIKKELKKKEIALSIILLGFLNGFIWEIVSLTNLVLKYNQRSISFATDGNIAKISSMLFLFMSVGSLIAIFLKSFNIKKGLKLIIILFTIMPIAALNVEFFLFHICICMVFYTFVEICIERFLDSQVIKDIRATCFSLVSIVLVLSQIFGYGIFSFLSKVYNPNYGIRFFSLFCMTFMLSITYFLIKEINKKKHLSYP